MGENGKVSGKPGMLSIISADLRVNGDLICSGDVHIDGWVEGDVQSRNISVGEGATIHGALQAEAVCISGLVKGEIKADNVILEKTARVTGDVIHKVLTIEQGAQLEGMCRRMDAQQTGVYQALQGPKDLLAASAERSRAAAAFALGKTRVTTEERRGEETAAGAGGAAQGASRIA